MLTVYSDAHRDHAPRYELFRGEFIAPAETPDRADSVLNQIRAVRLGQVVEPRSFGTGPLLRVHAPDFIDYLQTAWAQWAALGRDHDILPYAFPPSRSPGREPQQIDGKAGYFSFDTGAPISARTWQAVEASANCALTAQQLITEGAPAAFALCRPPGHHATSNLAGGYCYVNNAAVAAQAFIDAGARRVAILDVDYHHGNGTQEIFYRRDDVLFASIHARPEDEFPFFWGYASETGEGAGAGFNYNYPLPHGTGFAEWRLALIDACKRISHHAADVLVVSLGVDTFEADPISQFKLKSEDYLRMGETIGQLGLRTLFVLEGGYAVEQLGVNAVGVLQGFENTAK